MSELSWASHPSAALRLRIADYIGRGWTVEQLGSDWALLSRRKAWTKLGRMLINPLYLLYLGRTDREERVRLTVTQTDVVVESRVYRTDDRSTD